jgi:hypothetical protein
MQGKSRCISSSINSSSSSKRERCNYSLHSRASKHRSNASTYLMQNRLSLLLATCKGTKFIGGGAETEGVKTAPACVHSAPHSWAVMLALPTLHIRYHYQMPLSFAACDCRQYRAALGALHSCPPTCC